MLVGHGCTGPAHGTCSAKDLAGGKTRHPLSGVVGGTDGLPTFAVSLSLHRFLPAMLGREDNMSERAVIPYFAPILYFKGVFTFFP